MSTFHLSYFPNFITPEEEKSLLLQLQSLDWQAIKMYDKTAKRRVVHFGMDYTYSTRQVQPTTPAPDFLTPFVQRSAELLGVKPDEIAEILITAYPAGAGIGWHRDAPVFDKIVGISLGQGCAIKFRKRDEKHQVYQVYLEPRSVYILAGEIRTEWEHSISSMKAPRYSITLRTLRTGAAPAAS